MLFLKILSLNGNIKLLLFDTYRLHFRPIFPLQDFKFVVAVVYYKPNMKLVATVTRPIKRRGAVTLGP